MAAQFQVNSVQCVCPLGFEGAFCEKKKQECSAGLCRNGGKCSETPDGFTCSCAAGYTGLFCEQTINVSYFFLMQLFITLPVYYIVSENISV